MQDYYSILGLTPNCTQQEIRQKYRELALRYHPDHNAGNSCAEEKFKEIAQAYETLGNPKKRERYDLLSGRKTRVTREKNPQKTAKERTNNTAKTGTTTGSKSRTKTQNFSQRSTQTKRDRKYQPPPLTKAIINALKGHPFSKVGRKILQSREALLSTLTSLQKKNRQHYEKNKKKLQQQVDLWLRKQLGRIQARIHFPSKKTAKNKVDNNFSHHTRRKYSTKSYENKNYQRGELDIIYITPLSKPELRKGTNITVRIYNNAADEKYEFLDVTIPQGCKDGQRLRIRNKGHRCQASGKRGDLYLHLVQGTQKRRKSKT